MIRTRTGKLVLTLAAALAAVALLALVAPAVPAWAQAPGSVAPLGIGIRPAPAPQIKPLPTTYFYPYVAETGSTGATGGFANLVRWLVGDLSGSTAGPNWEVDEVYQAAGWGGGALRRVPADKHNLDPPSLPAAWVPAVNDWVVLRSQTGTYGTRFGLYLELHSTILLAVLMFPLDNWSTVVGGADASPPAYPAASIGAGAAGLIGFGVVNGAYRMSIVADVTVLQILSDNAGTREWMYIGELMGAKSDGTPADDRPFVIWDTPTWFYCSGALFNRLAPDDDATALTGGTPVVWLHLFSTGDTGYLGMYNASPDVVAFTDAGDYHMAGSSRHPACYSRAAGTLVQTADRCWLGIGSSAAPGRLLRWDCVTAYPGAAALPLSRGGHTQVPRDLIFGGGY